MKRAERARHGRLSLKSQRRLREWRLDEAFASGEEIVAVGRRYRLRDGALASLAFTRDGSGQLRVGCAVKKERWTLLEDEPYSARTLGYYQRWLKRHGESEG